MKCPNCTTRLVRRGRDHITKIGGLSVTDSTGMVMTCPQCGTVSLTQEELAAYERRAVKLVLTTAKRATGDVLRFARKSLGLRQKDLGELLGSNEQQVSRWEHEPELDRRLRLAVVALLDVAERGDEALANLAANGSRALSIVREAS